MHFVKDGNSYMDYQYGYTVLLCYNLTIALNYKNISGLTSRTHITGFVKNNQN